MEKYSVLMSVYNKENSDYFKIAVNSILNQTIMPDDFVIVCDGPLSNSLNTEIKFFETKYPDLFQIIRLEQNVGLGNALNEGLKYCKNELIARMDSDDISLPDRAEKLLNAFKNNPDFSIIGGQIAEFNHSPNTINSKRIVPCAFKDIMHRLKTRNPMNHVTVMFKKSHILSVGGYIEVKGYEDYHLWTRLVIAQKKLKNIPDILCYVRTSNDMYSRRGGYNYFLNSVIMEKFLLQNNIINIIEYYFNIITRFFSFVILPNSLRKLFYMCFTRKH